MRSTKGVQLTVFIFVIGILMFGGITYFITHSYGDGPGKIDDSTEGFEDHMQMKPSKMRSIHEVLFQKTDENIGEDKNRKRLVSNLSAYVEDGKMFIDFSVENVSDQTVELSFSSGQKYDFWIYNERNFLLYQWSEGKMFTMALETIQLRPKEKLKFSGSWNFVDRNGKAVDQKGIFQIVFQLTATIEDGDGIHANKENLRASISIDTRETKNK